MDHEEPTFFKDMHKDIITRNTHVGDVKLGESHVIVKQPNT